jgi:hypothetical protein
MKHRKSPPPEAERRRSLLQAAFFVFTCCAFYYLSGTNYPVPELDPSFQAVLEYATRLKLQFGRDIVFTYGPYGYLGTFDSQGHLIGMRIAAAALWAVVMAVIATSIVRRTTGVLRVLFVAWLFLFFRSGWIDAQGTLIVAFGSLLLMSDLRDKKGLAALFVITMALLGLIKFNLFLSAATGIAIGVALHTYEKRYASALIVPAAFSAAVVLFWLGAGQELSSFWPWIKGSVRLSAGYTEAMTFPPDAWVLLLSLGAVALFFVAVLMLHRKSTLTAGKAAALAVILVGVFLSWKHGFVRADLHVRSFDFFLPCAFILAFMERDQTVLPVGSGSAITLLYGCVIVLTVLAVNIQAGKSSGQNIVTSAVVDLPGRLWGNAKQIVEEATGRWKSCYAAVYRGAEQPRNPDLPLARTIIGRDTVDVIGFRQWAALANGLNYHPRPIIQGYSAYTPSLEDMDLAFFRSKDRPRFLLFKLESIDARYPLLDDAPVLPFIFRNYSLASRDGDFLVLRENEGAPVDVRKELVHEKTLVFGEVLDLSRWNNGPLLVRTTYRFPFLGRLYSFFYQAPILTMRLFAGEGMLNTRFIPAMAERGFLVNPLLLNNEYVVNYYRKNGVPVKGMSFSRASSALLTGDHIHVQVFRIR